MGLPASLPKLKLAEFSVDPLELPERSRLCLSTVHAANIDTNLKMNHLKTQVTGKTKDAIAGLGYTGDMYDVVWNTVIDQFGRPQVVVNAQLRRIYSFPPIKFFDFTSLVRYSWIVSNRVQVLKQMNYGSDLQSEGVLNSATRKLPLNMMTKRLTYARPNANYHMGLEAFSFWLREVAAVQEDVLMSGHHNPATLTKQMGKKEKAKGSTFATSATNTRKGNQKNQRECMMKVGNHPIWKCEKFKKSNVEERGQKARELRLCF